MNEAVLDASAILAYLREEEGQARAAPVIERGNAYVASVNYSEVIASLIEHGIGPGPAVSLVRDMELRVVDVDEALAVDAARLRSRTRSLGLSLADRVCLALGIRMQLPVLTTDEAWRRVRPGPRIVVIR